MERPHDLSLPTADHPLTSNHLEEVTELLSSGDPSSDRYRALAHRIINREPDAPYSELLHNLTHRSYDQAEAQELCFQIFDHERKLTQLLGRSPGVRVAALDYVINFLHRDGNLRLVDPTVLEQLYLDATIDPLMRIGNRRAYEERLSQELDRAKRYQTPFAIALFDVDDFKRVNDQQGHSAGDRVLQQIALIVQQCIRGSDMAARWGGEEIVLLMPQTHVKEAVMVAERIRHRVEVELKSMEITISGGIAVFPLNGESQKELFSYADRAMYRAKSEGKNRVCHTPVERRAFPRLDESLYVHISHESSVPTTVVAMTRNIGHGGISFRHAGPLYISTEINGDIEYKDGRAGFRGRLIYVEEFSPGQYEVGVKFTELKEGPWNQLLQESPI